MENKTNKVSSITRNSEFSLLRKKGNRFNCSGWMTIFYMNNSGSQIRFGWTLSRKIGNSVTRNKLKRWCREYFRAFMRDRDVLTGMDINVIFRPAEKNFYKEMLHRDFVVFIEKFCHKVLKKSLSDRKSNF